MSKTIKIEAGQEPAIQNAIDDAEGRARQRTVSAAEVIRHAAAVDHRLDQLGVPRTARTGIVTVVNGCVRLPNAYEYSAQATFVTIRRNSTGWRFVEAKREWNRPMIRTAIQLPFSTKELGAWAAGSEWVLENLGPVAP